MDAELRALLESSAWTRDLARRLAADPERAQDLVQDAWVAALTRPPRRGTPLRRWLAVVLRNAAAGARRGDARRSARERGVAREGHAAAADELVERLDLQRAVAAAVRELHEPYRSAILLRWFEGLGPRAIARRTGVPVRTVHSRLHRGLALLRERLAPPGDGDRPRRLAALAALGSPAGRAAPAAAAPTLVGASIMSAKTIAAASGVLAAGLVLVAVVPWERGEPVRAVARPAEDPDDVVLATAPDLLRPESPATRAAVASLPSEDAAGDAGPAERPAEPRATLRGRVVDPLGGGVPGVPVVMRPFGAEHDGAPVPNAVSDGRGAFEIEDPPSSGAIDAAGAAWATVLQPRLLGGERAEPVLVVAPAVRYAGVVVDATGAPVEGARVALEPPAGLRTQVGLVVDDSHAREWDAESDALGRFELAGAPGLDGAHLVARSGGRASAPHEASPLGDGALELVLAAGTEAEPSPDPLRGRVVDAEGAPVGGAWVALGEAAARADDAGEFALDPRGAGDDRRLRAAAAGFLQVELLATPGVPLEDAFPRPLVLVLAQRSAALRGEVAWSDGEPAPGVEVWSDDETPFGEIPWSDEGWAATRTIEALARGEDSPFDEPERTDADGRFELRGLAPRPYSVTAFDPRTHAWARSEPVRPGEVARVELRRAAPHERVAGRVTSLADDALEGVEVCFATPIGDELRWTEPVVTDADGRFEARDVPGTAEWVGLDGGDTAAPERLLLDADDDLAHLELRVPRLCRLRVEAPSAPDGIGVQVLDEGGEPLVLVVKRGWVATGAYRAPLENGTTEVLRTSELARTLVLRRAGVELARLPLDPRPDEIQVVRWGP